MTNFLGYRCSLCNQEFTPDVLRYTCPHDGGNLDVILNIEEIKKRYDKEDILSRVENSMWRYLPLLPVERIENAQTPFHSVGWTPDYAPPSLRLQTGLDQLWIKDEGRNPTGSLKDRASALVLAAAHEFSAEIVVTASTGNAGAALAGMAAAIGRKAVIFAPKTAPKAKIAQLLVYGAQVILVDGSYDEAFDLSVQAAKEFGWYCRNTGYNPFTVEGKKTAAFEIWENIITKFDLHSPLSIFVSVGDGNIISGLHKGFKDLVALGWLEVMPRIYGIQSSCSAAVANAFFAGTEHITPVKANTLADSISVDLPRDGVRAVRAAVQTKGAYFSVTDQQIVDAIPALGGAGIFAEPAGAAAYAGLLKALDQKMIQSVDPVLVVNTGSGLKDIQTAMQSVNPAPVIEPSIQTLKNHLNKNGH